MIRILEIDFWYFQFAIQIEASPATIVLLAVVGGVILYGWLF